MWRESPWLVRGWFRLTRLVGGLNFFSFLTSRASRGVMSWLESIVVESVSSGIALIVGSLWARRASEGSWSSVRLCPVILSMI